MQGVSRTPRRLALSAAAAIAALGTAAALTPATAGAAQITNYETAICLNPNGSATGTPGFANFQSGTPTNPSNEESENNCGQSGGQQQDMSAVASAGGTAIVDAGWTFQAPAGTTIVGGTEKSTDDGFSDNLGGSSSIWLDSSPTPTTPSGQPPLSGQNIVFSCDAGSCRSGNGQTTVVAHDGNIVTVPIPDYPGATALHVEASTGAPGGSGNGTGEIDLHSADIALAADSTPSLSNLGGTILQPNAHGTATLSFALADGNPGISNYAVLIDGTTVASQSLATGNCASVGTDQFTGYPIYDSLTPCPTSATTGSTPIQIQTGSLADGNHELEVTVTDAGGETQVVEDTTISTKNSTSPSSTSTEGVATGSTGPAGSTTVNGSTGSETGNSGSTVVVPVTVATGTKAGTPIPRYSFTLGARSAKLAGKTITRSYRRSGLTLTGTVLGTTGQGLANAPVKVIAAALGGGAAKTIATATSDGTGAFTIKVPRGDGRTLSLQASDGSVIITELVSPTLSIKVTNRGARTALITGHVALAHGSAPQLVLQIHHGKTWQLLGSAFNASKTGSYRTVYTAVPQAAHRSYQLRVVVLKAPQWTTAASTPKAVTL